MQQRDIVKDPTLAKKDNVAKAPARPKKPNDGALELKPEQKSHFFEIAEGMMAALHSKTESWDAALDILPRFDVTERVALVSLFEANHGVNERTPSVMLTGMERRDRLEQALATLQAVVTLAHNPGFAEASVTFEALEEEIQGLRDEITKQIADEAAKRRAKPDAEKKKKADEEEKKKKKKKND
jgi:hypothetical protein